MPRDIVRSDGETQATIAAYGLPSNEFPDACVNQAREVTREFDEAIEKINWLSTLGCELVEVEIGSHHWEFPNLPLSRQQAEITAKEQEVANLQNQLNTQALSLSPERQASPPPWQGSCSLSPWWPGPPPPG